MAVNHDDDIGLPLLFKDGVREKYFQEFFPQEVVEAHPDSGYYEREFERLLDAIRYPPVYSTLRVNTRQYDIRDVINELGCIINKSATLIFRIVPHPTISDVIIVESPSLCLHRLEACREMPQVIVDVRCACSIMRGANIYGRGVIGLTTGSTSGEKVSIYGDLDGDCRRGLKTEYNGRKFLVAIGTLKISRKDLFEGRENASGMAVEVVERRIANPSLNGILEKKIFAQNLPSTVCGHVLNPQRGDTVLDMCAAPGGKTTHIATLMNDTGCVIALDKASLKIEDIKDNVRHMDLTCVRVFKYDATHAVDATISPPANGLKLGDRPPFPPESFDRVLLDAPCSATGQRAPISYKHTVHSLSSYAAYQRRLFHSAVQLLKPGGTLVYSTCTLMTTENEAVVSWALKTFPELALADQSPYVGSPGLPCYGLTHEQATKLQRFCPASRFSADNSGNVVDCNNDTIGFFIAKFVKTVSSD